MVSGRGSLLSHAVTLLGSALVLVFLWFSLSLYPHNSDHYFFPRVAQQLVEQGGSLADWLLISAPRYFPDLLIDVVSFSIAGSGDAGLALASALLVVLQWFGVSLLAWRMGMNLFVSAIAGMMYCAGCAILGPHYTSFAYIAWHAGTFAIIVICLALATTSSGRVGILNTVLLMLMAALVTASNVLALPLLTTGMALVSIVYLLQNYFSNNFLLRYQGWWQALLTPAVATLGGCLAGIALYYNLMPYPFTNPVDASSLNLGAIKNPELMLRASLATIVSLSELPVFVAAFIGTVAGLLSLARTRWQGVLLAVAGFWLITSVVNQGLIELGAKDETRYLIMPINGSIMMCALVVTLIAARWRVVFLLPIIAGIFMVATWQDVQSLYLKRHEDFKVETACLLNQVSRFADLVHMTRGVVVGVSDLSTAKTVPYLSNGALRIIATKGTSKSVLPFMQEVPLMRGSPVYAIARLVKDDQKSVTPPPPYVHTEPRARYQYGKPAARYACDNYVVLHYPQGLPLTPPAVTGLPVTSKTR